MRNSQGALLLSRAEPKSFHGPTDHQPAIGQPLRRKEDGRLLIGKGRFSDDFSLPGQTYAALVRSTHPHAKFTVRRDMADAVPGVLGVFTGSETLDDGIEPLPHAPVPSTKYDMKLTAPDGTKNVFIGPHRCCRPIARASSAKLWSWLSARRWRLRSTAPRRSRSITRICPSSPKPSRAAHDSAAVWDEVPDNVLVDTQFGDIAATDAAFAAADHVVSAEFKIARVTAVAMEPRACLADYDAATDHYTLWAGSGGAVRQKAELAAAVAIPEKKLRVLSMDVGGNFGSRNRPYVEFGLVLWAARKLRRPVKFTATRTEFSSAIIKDAISSLASRSRCGLTASSSRCVRTISAMSARIACRCRRSAKARG